MDFQIPARKSAIGKVLFIKERSYDSKSLGHKRDLLVIGVRLENGKVGEFVSLLTEAVEKGDTIFLTYEKRVANVTGFVITNETTGEIVTTLHQNTSKAIVSLNVLERAPVPEKVPKKGK